MKGLEHSNKQYAHKIDKESTAKVTGSSKGYYDHRTMSKDTSRALQKTGSYKGHSNHLGAAKVTGPPVEHCKSDWLI